MRNLILAALAVVLTAASADAQLIRRRASASSRATYTQTPAGSSYSASTSYRGPADLAAPALAAVAPPTAGELAGVAGIPGAVDALDEVNRKRAAHGLYPYQRDDALTVGAARAAHYRASRLMFGHVTHGAGDFQFLPPGATCAATGCAAYPDALGWMSCEDTGRTYRYAGAAWVRGADGRRYMHAFFR